MVLHKKMKYWQTYYSNKKVALLLDKAINVVGRTAMVF